MTRTITRAFVGIAASLLAAGMVAMPAAAAQPSKAPNPAAPGPLPGCPFSINVTFPRNDESIKTFVNPPRQQINGSLTADLTATFADGSTQTLHMNISGPGEIDTQADGSATVTFEGNSVIFAVVNGVDTVLKTSGHFVVTVSNPSTVLFGTLVAAAGRQADVCSLFSPPA